MNAYAIALGQALKDLREATDTIEDLSRDLHTAEMYAHELEQRVRDLERGVNDLTASEAEREGVAI